MRPRRLTPLAAILAIAASCTSGEADRGGSRSAGAPADSAPPPATFAWFDSVAPLLLAPSHSNDRALVVAADSLAPDLEDRTLERPGTLIRLDGSRETVRVSLSSSSEGCVDGVLQPAPADPWGVGFVGRAPTGIGVDSIRSIARKDSAALAAIVFRLASGVPNDSSGRFAGLPFSLVDLWRLKSNDGATIVVGTTRRQLNQEDSPLEERTLVIGEAAGKGSFTLAYSTRADGPEETVEGSDLLAAVSLGQGDLQLVFSHDYGDETSFSLVERTSAGHWHLRWASRRFSC